MDVWIDFDSVLVTKLVLDFVNFLFRFICPSGYCDIVPVSVALYVFLIHVCFDS